MPPETLAGCTPEVEGDITNVVIKRTLCHKGNVAKPGHVWYEYSFVQGEVKVSSAVQITSAWDEANDGPSYIRKTYIYKRDILPGQVKQAKARKPKRQFDTRQRTQQ